MSSLSISDAVIEGERNRDRGLEVKRARGTMKGCATHNTVRPLKVQGPWRVITSACDWGPVLFCAKRMKGGVPRASVVTLRHGHEEQGERANGFVAWQLV